MSTLPMLSSLMGWTYVTCWSVSMYPPILLNARLKSVEGMSVDFVYLNMIGYIAYTISVLMLYFNSRVRSEYAQRHSLTATGELNYPLVRFNDVAYGVHGTCIVVFTMCQIYLKGYTRGAHQRVSKYIKLISILSVFAFSALGVYALSIQEQPKHFELYDVATLLGNVKVCMSATKYFPQVMHNHRRRSTKGWSMTAVRLDIIGGILSLCQLFLDGYIRNDMKGVWNNSVKLALAGITLFFDVVFIIQNYIYRGRDELPTSQEMQNLD